MNQIEKIEQFAELVENQTLEMYAREYPGTPSNCVQQNSKAHIKEGKKYVKVDVGSSGKFMIDAEGNIFGIKGYGVIHRGHQYGTLDTTDEWNWGDYTPFKRNN